MNKKESRLAIFIGGMVVGGAVGSLLSLLTAPRTGKQTRQIIKKSADALPEIAEDVSSSVQLQAERISESAGRNWDETLERLKMAIAAGVEASQRLPNPTSGLDSNQLGDRN